VEQQEEVEDMTVSIGDSTVRTDEDTLRDASLVEEMRASVGRAALLDRRRRRIVLLCQVAILGAFVGGWEYAARSGVLPNANIFYGQPSGVAEVLWNDRDRLLDSWIATMRAAIGGFVIGVVLAIVIGVVLAQVATLNRIFDPFLVVLAGLPRIALAPLFVLWFGINDSAKIALSISLVLFTVVFNVRAGIQSVDRDLLTVAKTFGESRLGVLWKVTFPASVPVLFAALRLALVFSILGVIASEMMASRGGLGFDVVSFAQTLRPNGLFAVLVILAATMTTLNWFLRVFERRLLKWSPS
jgi:NitT/TauT family transport system permease protein